MSVGNYEIFNLKPCPSAGPGICNLSHRSVQAGLGNTGGTVAGSNNMIAWVNNCFTPGSPSDINQVAWGTSLLASFNQPGDINPETISTANVAQQISQLSLYEGANGSGGGIISPQSLAVASQIWIGIPRAYLVLGVGVGGGGNTTEYPIAVCGCTYTPANTNSQCGSYILNLPTPDQTLGSLISVYVFAPVGTDAGAYPDITTFAESYVGISSAYGGGQYGPNWNANKTCALMTDDPFTGNAT